MTYRLGRKPPRPLSLRQLRRKSILHRALRELGPAPAASPDYVAAVMSQSPDGWGMALNDTYGDCTIASEAHQDMLRSANAGTIVVTPDAVVAAIYAVVQGYTGDLGDASAVTAFLSSNDNGANESDVGLYLTTTGVGGRKLSGFVNVNPANLDDIKWSVCIFGSCNLGINVYAQAQDLYEAGQPWDAIAGATVEGGHAVPVVKYDEDGTFYVVTWGKLQAVTPAFMAAKFDDGTPYVEEAHAELGLDFLNASGATPRGLDLHQLMDDLRMVSLS